MFRDVRGSDKCHFPEPFVFTMGNTEKVIFSPAFPGIPCVPWFFKLSNRGIRFTNREGFDRMKGMETKDDWNIDWDPLPSCPQVRDLPVGCQLSTSSQAITTSASFTFFTVPRLCARQSYRHECSCARDGSGRVCFVKRARNRLRHSSRCSVRKEGALPSAVFQSSRKSRT